jgi:hypothetical protein
MGQPRYRFGFGSCTGTIDLGDAGDWIYRAGLHGVPQGSHGHDGALTDPVFWKQKGRREGGLSIGALAAHRTDSPSF